MEENIENIIKEEAYKCSKCGLCQSVCPIYLATKNENYSPRGRYIIINRNSNLSRQFIKNLDFCLNCNLCTQFCPSNIDSYKIYTLLKNIKGYKYSFISFSALYRIKLNIYRIFSHLYKILPFKSFLLNTYLDDLFDVKIKRKKREIKKDATKIIYFEGCYNKYINPSDKNATLNIIEKLGYKVEAINSQCCGITYLSDGNIVKFKANSERILKSITNDIKYIVCSCDSCYETLKCIANYIDVDTNIMSKLITLDKLLELNKYNVEFSDKYIYYKPINRKEKSIYPQNASEINKKGICTLMENFLLLKYPNIVKKMIEKTFYKREEIDNKNIYTTCQLAKLGLKMSIREIKSNAKVMSYSEVAEYCDNI